MRRKGRRRGCIRKTETQPPGLTKGEFRWDLIIRSGSRINTRGNSVPKYKWTRFEGTRDAAEKKVTELLGQIDQGDFIASSKVSVGQWLEGWLDKAVRGRKAENTYALYALTINKHL